MNAKRLTSGQYYQTLRRVAQNGHKYSEIFRITSEIIGDKNPGVTKKTIKNIEDKMQTDLETLRRSNCLPLIFRKTLDED